MKHKYFFKADAVHHYQIKIDGEVLHKLEFDEHASERELLKRQIIFDEQHPSSIREDDFIEQLPHLGFVKRVISESQLSAIQAIFKLKEINAIEPSYCGAVFRDVLVFYDDQKITGLAKLCFSCQHHVIVGTDLNTTYFGQQGDYHLLQKLLKV